MDADIHCWDGYGYPLLGDGPGMLISTVGMDMDILCLEMDADIHCLEMDTMDILQLGKGKIVKLEQRGFAAPKE
jgi:hypothetical protein